MNKFELTRSYLTERTVGQIRAHGEVYCTLERPWVGNQPNVSCIPEGTYLVKRDETGRHQYYAIQNVQGRTHIEIHAANAPSQLMGCVALGEFFDADKNLINSKRAVEDFLARQQDDSFILVVRQFNPLTDEWLR